MRKLLVTTLVFGSFVACSSSEPIAEVRIPAPVPEEPEPDRTIAEPEPGEIQRSPSKSLAAATPATSPNLAKRAPIAMIRARGNEASIVACGKTTCASGEFCCNESCGICAPAGGACTQQACDE